MARRSEPGEGRIVGLYLLDKAEHYVGDSVMGRPPGVFTTMCGSIGEDYAATTWAVVVKAHPEVNRQDLARHLRDLAEAVENGFFMEVNPDGAPPPSGGDAREANR
jgi:hypothetical protein